jgi:hypothetical protein
MNYASIITHTHTHTHTEIFPSWQGPSDVSLLQKVQTCCGAYAASCSGLKWPVREANHSPSSNAHTPGRQFENVHICARTLHQISISFIRHISSYRALFQHHLNSSRKSLRFPPEVHCAALEFHDIQFLVVVTSVLPSSSVHLRATRDCTQHSYSTTPKK